MYSIWLSFFIIVPIIYGTLVHGNIVIESDKVTDWGPWGNWDKCPDGKFASAFQLRTEGFQGGGNWDDSALNAIRLFCADPSSTNNPDLDKPITSSEGPYGDWGKVFNCDGGVITGFQLRQEENQGWVDWSGEDIKNANDDSAANNLRVYCSNKDEYIQGDGMDWGKWGSDKKCLKSQAVCGIQTQVEEYKKSGTYGIKGGDYSALNNVKMECCDIVSPGKTCIPKDNWNTVTVCDGINSITGAKCTYPLRRGVEKGSEAEGMTDIVDDINALKENFELHYGYSGTTGTDWTKQSSTTWTTETTETAELDVNPGHVSELEQVVGTCGDFTIYTSMFRLKKYVNGNLLSYATF